MFEVKVGLELRAMSLNNTPFPGSDRCTLEGYGSKGNIHKFQDSGRYGKQQTKANQVGRQTTTKNSLRFKFSQVFSVWHKKGVIVMDEPML